LRFKSSFAQIHFYRFTVTGVDSVDAKYLNRSDNYKVMHEICAVLGYYATRNDNSLPTFWHNLSVPSSRVKQFFFFLDCLILEYGTDRMSRNVGTELPFFAANISD
jgi:hypothetical protein